MKIIYRISDAGYSKVKPDYITNEACLANAAKVFKDADWSIIADNVSKETSNMIEKYKSKDHIYYVSEEGFKLGSPYVTLYLHPDKFIPPNQGGNPEVDEAGGYLTRIYRGETELFGMFNSTTMTFASTVKNLKEDEEVLRKWTSGTHPNDFEMFLELREKGKALMCPLNTYSTHGETGWLAPLYKTKQQDLVEEWSKHI